MTWVFHLKICLRQHYKHHFLKVIGKLIGFKFLLIHGVAVHFCVLIVIRDEERLPLHGIELFF